MRIVVSISIPYEGPLEEYFKTVEQARQYIQNLSPSGYNWSLDNVNIYEISREIDVYELLAGGVTE